MMNKISFFNRSVSLFRPAVYLLFFVSGALGLSYEILWMRKLLLIFGNTVYAASTVLGIFFMGLGAGSWWFGTLIDKKPRNGLLWYAFCEAVVGIWAFITVPFFNILEPLYLSIYRISGFSQLALASAEFLCSACVLLFPAVLMGGTFPLISRFLIKHHESRGEVISLAYGINTLGAVIGTVLVYYVGLSLIGFKASLELTGTISIFVALCAFFLSRLSNVENGIVFSGYQSSASEASINGIPVILFAFGLSGFSAMLYQICWTRSLSLILGSSVYAFCIILCAFLSGIGLGSLVARYVLKKEKASEAHIVMLEVCICGYGLFSIAFFRFLPDWFLGLWPFLGKSFAGLSFIQWFLSMSVIFMPTFFMGLLFPIVGQMVTCDRSRIGKNLGLAYAINTVGTILGSLICGFWMLPKFGLVFTICFAAAMNLIAGLLVYVRFDKASFYKRILFVGAAILAFILVGRSVIPMWNRRLISSGAFLDPVGFGAKAVDYSDSVGHLLFYRDGANATVTVNDLEGKLTLSVNGKVDASNGIDMGTQVLSAHIPMFIHKGVPKDVLVIGLGSGVTAGSVGRYPVSRIDCVEIEPAVIEASKLFYEHNYKIHWDPRFSVYAADGRNFLLAKNGAYDVIISEPSNPWMAGISSLYTKEFYEICKKHIKQDGLMVQWLQIYRIFPQDVKLIIKTFKESFPHVSVWSTTVGDLVLVGSGNPQSIDYQDLKRKMSAYPVKKDLERVYVSDPMVLLEFFLFDSERASQIAFAVQEINSDDKMLLEFHAPMALYDVESAAKNYSGIKKLRVPPSSIVDGMEESVKDFLYYSALGDAYLFREELRDASSAYEKAVQLNPDFYRLNIALADSYVRQGKYLQAIEKLERAIMIEPSDPQAYIMLARLKVNIGRTEEAVYNYMKSASSRSPDVFLSAEIGSFLLKNKRWLEASEFLRSAMSLTVQPDVTIILGLADALSELKSLDEASFVFALGMMFSPEDPSIKVRLAQVRYEQGRRSEARNLFEQAIGDSPGLSKAYFGLGLILIDEGDFNGASLIIRHGLKYDPYNAKALEMLESVSKARNAV